jgi:hypothetical protein
MYGMRALQPLELSPRSYANGKAIENQSNDVDPAKRYAIEFDGNRYAMLPRTTYDGSHSLTLEARIKIGKSGSGDVISNLQRAGISISVLDRHLVFTVHDGRKYVWVKSFQKLTDQETHVAGVFDGMTLKVFINGKPTGMTSFSGRYRRSRLTFMIGANPEDRKPPINLFSGVIDEVRVSSTARYDDEFTPSVRFDSDEFTIALYHFDEGSGEIVNDSSGRGFHGKIAGAKWIKTPDRSPQSKRPLRQWTSSVGTHVIARLISVADDKVNLENADGRQLNLAIDQLSEKDQAYVQSLR